MNASQEDGSQTTAPRVNLESLCKSLLAEATGVEEGSNDPIPKQMEAWLSTSNSLEGDCKTLEDCLPLPANVYSAAANVLKLAWGDPQEDTYGAWHSIENDEQESITLYDILDSVRVTQWMVQWMGYDETLWNKMLKSETTTSAESSSVPSHLAAALFHHLATLPRLQSQIYSYSQSLRQQSAPDRLAQYRLAQQVSERLQVEWQSHLDRLEIMLGSLYQAASARVRKSIRRLLGRLWNDFYRQSQMMGRAGGGLENTRATSVALTLRVLYRILLGITTDNEASDTAVSSNRCNVGIDSEIASSSSTTSAPSSLRSSYRQLVQQHLLPLHEANGTVLWRDQMPILELFHVPLTQCIAVLIQKDRSHDLLDNVVMPALLQLLAARDQSSTGKQVLVLHEVDTYITLRFKEKATLAELPKTMSEEATDIAAVPSWSGLLLKLLARYLSSDHSRVAQRALQFFRNKEFNNYLVYSQYEVSLKSLLPGLVQQPPSWNPSVRKITFHVLKDLEKHDPDAFRQISDLVFAAQAAIPASESTPNTASTARPASSGNALPVSRADNSPRGTSLSAGMGTWKPPGPSSNGSSRPRQPPATVTGVAPWAMCPAPIRPKQPPATVTGVAPWAMQGAPPMRPCQSVRAAPSKPNRPNQGQGCRPPVTVTGVAPWAMSPQPRVASTLDIPQQPSMNMENSGGTGASYVQAYMKQIKPPHEDADGVSSWSKAQQAETPTLLPNLRFYDLVFGQELGSGAFSVVKYARMIDREKTRSSWAEYAIKIISTSKIKQLSYEASVQREITVLRLLSHPGIARLISSFRFREGAYLVLEYASRGDLHSLLKAHGSMDHDSTRFVVGEVAAALNSIHELGLAYVDLKPENIVITEPGHIKLTDFGGCRPVTKEAKLLVNEMAKNALNELRSGDWKDAIESTVVEDKDEAIDWNSGHQTEQEKNNEETINSSGLEEDNRVEGTTAYLPPELVMGALPSVATDAWALGCVMYQCLSGRPPLMDADEDATRNRIVTFAVNETNGSATDKLFSGEHASHVSTAARSLISSLLNRVDSERPTMNEVASADFFTEASVDLFALHKGQPHPLDAGTVAPKPDAKWARRQLSSIWAPQPVSYNVQLPNESKNVAHSAGQLQRDVPIGEGDEAPGTFLPYSSTKIGGPLPGAPKLIASKRNQVPELANGKPTHFFDA